MKKLSTLLIAISAIAFTSQAQNTWTQKADFGGLDRLGATSFSIGNKGYVGTGRYGYPQKDFWEYDPELNAWTQKADFGGAARYDAVGFNISDKGYLGTGTADEFDFFSDFWEFDPELNSWTQKADFGGGERSDAVGFSIGNHGYIGTGTVDYYNTYYKDFWEYDPGLNAWTHKADFGGGGRLGAICFTSGSKGYVGTGHQASNYYNDLWEYNPTTDIWTQKADFGGTVRWGAVSFTIGTKGYVGTGRSSDGSYENDFWEYNPDSDTWSQKADFGGIARYYAVGLSIEGNGYIGTGAVGYGFKKDFWEYNAACDGLIVYLDSDSDGYGDDANSIVDSSCVIPDGYSIYNGDCDDNNAAVHPYAIDSCNGIDDNCDGVIDPLSTFYADADADGYGNSSDSIIDCVAPDGYVANNNDCNDANPDINPGAAELCNNVDDNCNGAIDGGLVFTTYYVDADGDTYGNTNNSISSCEPVNGYVIDNTDCDDANPDVNPAALEIPNNGIDDNCNGDVDEFGVGIYSIENNASILSVFPNPTDGAFMLFLNSENENSEAKIEVINALGQVVFSQNSTIRKGKLQQDIQLSNVAEGMYLVKVIIGDHIYISQINLQK